MSKKNFQFFTTDTDMDSTWFPMDHFFYAESKWDKHKLKTRQTKKIVHLEGWADVNSPTGLSIDVVTGSGINCKREVFPSYSAALHRMACIIEANEEQARGKKS